MEPIQYLRTIRRRWILIVAFCVVGGLVGAALGFGHKKSATGTTYWRATCVLYYDGSNVSQQGAAFTALAQMGLLATTGDLPARIAQQRHTDPESLTTRVLSVTDTQQATIRLTTVGTSATDTNQLADTWCQGLAADVNKRNTDAFSAQVNTLAKSLDGLTNQINGLTAQNPGANTVAGQKLQALINQYRLDDEQFQALGQPPGPILTVLQRPTPIPISPSAYSSFLHNGQLQNNNVTLSNSVKNPEIALDSSTASKSKVPQGPIPRGLIGAFLGLMLGLVVAFVIERLDTRLQTKEDTELAFDLPVLAEVPPLTRAQRHDTEVLSYTHPMSRTAEAYRSLRSSILFLRQTMEPTPPPEGTPTGASRTSQVILVTSAGPGEGKTTTAANLAAVFAEAEYAVLVINCDFRRPRLHRYLGGSEEPRKVVQSDIPGVRMVNNVVSSSHPNPAEVTAAQRRVIEAARGIFDIILLDTAPLLSTNDASELIGVADLVLLVSRVGRTTRPSAQRATEVLHRLEATVAGVAMLGARYIPSAQYYYYATEEGRDPTRAEAESHPLDLLVRADDLGQARPNGAPTWSTPSLGDDERLEVELQGSGSGSAPKDE
ncbi:MAG TPA: division plane positioning ATPase MipZ [Acidimicrobiales bacterium]|nr:division plane positioning ATPase MipZ [Acidimicrobiales bacterium]